MKILIKTKLIDPTHCEVRDYELNKTDLKIIHCKSDDYRNCFHKGEAYMILPLIKHNRGKVINTQQSKFYPYAYYKILKFLWKPTGVVEEDVLSDKNWTIIGNTARLKS